MKCLTKPSQKGNVTETNHFTMRKGNNALEIIELTAQNSRESLEKHLNIALILAETIYQKIPQGKWKTFFEEKMKFGIGLGTYPALVFLKQKKRILGVRKLRVRKDILEKFLKRNFNLLIEALLYPFYENSETEAEAVDHALSVEIPADFSFNEEDFLELQQAFAGDVILTKKKGNSSDRENQQGDAVFFTFMFCTKK